MNPRLEWLPQNILAVLEQQSHPVTAGEIASILDVSEAEVARATERLVVHEHLMAVRLEGVVHFTLPGRPVRPPPRRHPSTAGWGHREPDPLNTRSASDEIALLKRRLAEAEARAGAPENNRVNVRLADLERRLEMALRENDELRLQARAAREEAAVARAEAHGSARALGPLVQDLLILCHPDRHGSNDRSTRITQILLEIRKSHSGR